MGIVKDTIIQDILTPFMAQYAHMAIGYILHYDTVRNRCTIEYVNHGNGDRILADDVIIARPPFAFHAQEPKAGDRCVVSFNGGDVTAPIVITYFDEMFERKDGPYERLHAKHAATVPDILSYI